jgi:hypothetical protein
MECIVGRRLGGWIADEAREQGVLRQGKVKGLGSDEEVFRYVHAAAANLGAICRSLRAEKLFGWKPTIKWSREEVGEIVRVEAELKGLVKGALMIR